MTLNEYILRLQSFANLTDGNLPVAITQSGYYADGRFAELFDIPEIKESYGEKLIVLGHSHQSY